MGEIGNIPPEICSRIVQHSRHSDLLHVARTTKNLQAAAESRLYNTLLLRDPNTVFKACSAVLVAGSPRGRYVQRFYFYFDPRQVRSRTASLPVPFWECVRDSLALMPNLQDIFISDPTCANTWILDPLKNSFQLKAAKLSLVWDAHMVAFLQEQSELRYLQVRECFPDQAIIPLASSKLPALEVFEGHPRIAMELLGCKLTTLRFNVEDGQHIGIPNMIQRIITASTPLRTLHIIHISQQVYLRVMNMITASSLGSQLYHLGVIHYPWAHRHLFHEFLTKFHNLESLEVEIASWEPHPTGVFRRVIVKEMHIYCPTLRHVVFWISYDRTYSLTYNGTDWIPTPTPGRQESSLREA